MEGKQKRRLKRPEQEIEEDIRKYHELLAREQELEIDIPPRRTRSKGMEPKVKTIDLKKKAIVPKEKELHHKMPSQTALKPSSLPKPKFRYSHTKIPSMKALQYKHKSNMILLTDRKNINSFETKLLVENSYGELIRVIRSNLESKEATGAIDLGMTWNLMPKNIEYEKNRFLIDCEEEREFAKQLVDTVFSYGDVIDYYFQNLKEHPNSGNRNIPLV